jgi:large subunit ribosomal protein L21
MTQKSAVIRTGSKQYHVVEGDIIDVELLSEAEVGKSIEFKDILYVRNGGEVQIGSPALSALVRGEVLSTLRGPKVIAYKYKKRKNYRRKVGHRQHYNRIKVTEIQV